MTEDPLDQVFTDLGIVAFTGRRGDHIWDVSLEFCDGSVRYGSGSTFGEAVRNAMVNPPQPAFGTDLSQLLAPRA